MRRRDGHGALDRRERRDYARPPGRLVVSVVKSDYAKYGRIIREGNIKIDN